ncbi:MAG: hypothetical protein AAF468_21960 [Pseudomonadota bacterium]
MQEAFNSPKVRLFLAVLIAPFAGAVIVIATYTPFDLAPINDWWEMLQVALAYGYATTIALGLPYHLILRHLFMRDHIGWYVAGGLVIGAAVLQVFFVSGIQSIPLAIVYGGAPGIIIAVIARWIVGPSRFNA